MAFDPQQCRVLLVGKLMARLEPFLKGKGYTKAVSEESGEKAVALLGEQSFHLVLFQLNLSDIELRDFFLAARENQRDASFILLAPPNEAEMIVSAMVLGADAYVTLPPDEDELFLLLERHGTAALQRKAANPNAQPGVSEKIKQLEEELAKFKAQVEDLEEQRGMFEAETVRLRKELEAATKKAEAAKSTPVVPEGHRVIAIAALEELESKATFIEFLESENDEIKKERDSLVAKLRELGMSDAVSDDVVDEFDEPTGAVSIDDLPPSIRSSKSVAQTSDAAAAEVALVDDDDDDDEDALLIMDDDSEEIDVAALEAAVEKPTAKSAPAPAPAPAAPPATVVEAVEDGDGEDDLGLDELGLDDESEELDLALLEEMMAKSPEVKKAAAAQKASAPAAPQPVPPPSSDDEKDDTGFEDVNTDALLRLAADLSSSDEGAPSADDLEELLAAIDDD